jgi:hypothetical protein
VERRLWDLLVSAAHRLWEAQVYLEPHQLARAQPALFAVARRPRRARLAVLLLRSRTLALYLLRSLWLVSSPLALLLLFCKRTRLTMYIETQRVFSTIKHRKLEQHDLMQVDLCKLIGLYH